MVFVVHFPNHCRNVNNNGKYWYNLYIFTSFYNYFISFVFKDKINFFRVLGLLICIGVFTIISKGNLDFLINLNFTTGDLWVIGAAMGWALYSIYLLNWKSKFSLMADLL